jgi:hypothetical protein
MPRPETDRRGWFERFLLSFMGPPPVGDAHAPLPPVSSPSPRCPQCGTSYDEHEVVRDPGLTYTRCPSTRVP